MVSEYGVYVKTFPNCAMKLANAICRCCAAKYALTHPEKEGLFLKKTTSYGSSPTSTRPDVHREDNPSPSSPVSITLIVIGAASSDIGC